MESFERLPGVGPKSAQRLSFYILKMPQVEVEKLSQSLNEVKEVIKYCENCRNLDDISPCSLCENTLRIKNILIVVSGALDVFSFEKVGYRGQYFVLHGNIDPLNNIGPDDLCIPLLIKRVKEILSSQESLEIVLATSTSLEGEATSMYISKLLKEDISISDKVKISRIARGIPIGGDIEYADDITLSKAFEGRSQF